MSRQLILGFAIVFCGMNFAVDVDGQELDASQVKAFERIKKKVDEAGKLFRSKEYRKSAARIKVAQRDLVKLAGELDTDSIKKLKTEYERIQKAHKILKAKGEELAILPSWPDLLEKKVANSEEVASESDDGSQKISFTKQVAPILIEHCGDCHISRQLGRYSVSTYELTKKKSTKGIVVKPNDTKASRLISLIESGAMPKKKPKMPEEQIQILKDWVLQGAEFDGKSKDKKKNITEFASE